MANVTTELKVLVRAIGRNEIDKLSKSLGDLGKKAVEPVNQDLKASVAQLKTLSQQSTKTKNNVKGFSTAFKELADNLEIGSKEFKQATAEAARLDKQLEKMERRRQKGGRLKGAVGVVGATAAAGVFGGPEGALGALAGGLIGGPAGAAVGGAIGAQVGGIRQAAGATAEYSANLGKLRIALLGVTTSQAEYQEGLQFIQQTTKDFAIPQEVVTRQFTKLQASVQGAGGNLEDTKTAFNGIVAAVRATGGSLADVDSALTATAQVFSKGKVSAEELRQQIGERLPGAFTLFAESMGKTPAELDKALEQGEVSLQDFLKFSKAIFERYGENAKTIASGPKSAGDRLKVTLEQLSENVGTLLEPIGAAFQETFKQIVEVINQGIVALQNFLGIGTKGAMNKAQRELDDATSNFKQFLGVDPEELGPREKARLNRARNRVAVAIANFEKAKGALAGIDVEQPEAGTGLDEIDKNTQGNGSAGNKRLDITREEFELRQKIVRARQTGNKFARLDYETQLKILRVQQSKMQPLEGQIKIQEINQTEGEKFAQLIENEIRLLEGVEKAQFNAGKAIADRLNKQDKMNAKVKEELTETDELSKKIGQSLEQGIGSALEGIIFQTKSLKESLSDVLRSVAQLFIQFGVRSAFSGLGLDSFFKMNAYGNVYAQNGVVPFARGGIVNKPTLFPFAKGIGLMGEAGPEAIMPLKRGPSGRLGVESSGGGTSVVVNVDAKGTQVQGSDNRGKALGSAISAAIQAELVRQKRPGGLLA